MNCPFCGGAMRKGKMWTNNYSRLRWTADGEKVSLVNAVYGRGIIRNVHMNNNKCELESFVCDRCGKMIADVRIEK